MNDLRAFLTWLRRRPKVRKARRELLVLWTLLPPARMEIYRSAPEIAEITGLNPGYVSALMRELESEGSVRSTRETTGDVDIPGMRVFALTPAGLADIESLMAVLKHKQLLDDE